ncbi:Flowering time control protein FY [Dictyocoela muelleri]|nr:Flowering time control protein FY [Dictyocoela muelleri]
MNDQTPNLKEIIAARFQNPKFIFDGKRMRTLTERRAIDYSSAVVYYRHFPKAIHKNILKLKFAAPQHHFDGDNYINGNLDFKNGNLRFNNCGNISLTTQFAHISINKFKCPVNVVKFVPNGRRLITGTATGEFTLWNGFSFNFETILQAHESPIRSMCWSKDASFLVSGDNIGNVKYWHPSMNNIFEFQAHEEAVRDISFSVNSSKIVTGSDDCQVKVWDSKTGKLEQVLSGHGWDVRCCKWHETKSIVASGGKDNLVKLWDPRLGAEIKTLFFHKNAVNDIKWQGDLLLSASKDQTTKMIDIRNLMPFTYSTNKEVNSIAVHPFLNNFVTSADSNLIFWQYFNPNPLAIVKAHDSAIWSIDYHPMGHVLASGSIDQSTRFWIRKREDENDDEVVKNNYEDFKEIPGL